MKVIDEVKASTSDEKSPSREPKQIVTCSLCDESLALLSDAINVFGRHEHTKVNTFGYTHRFRCFREALGCTLRGPQEFADSWFPECTWQLAMCGSCDSHIGWLFEGKGHFYGLLTNRVTIRSGPHTR